MKLNRVSSWIAILFAVSVCAGFFFTDKIDGQAFMAVAGACVGYFFKEANATTTPTIT